MAQKTATISGVEPDYIKEYTEAIKQCLAQRREISNDLNELEEKFKELQAKTSDLAEEDKQMDKEISTLRNQVDTMKEKFRGYADAQLNVPTLKK